MPIIYSKKIISAFQITHFSREMIYSYKREIIGFKLIVENIEAAYKLSQNRNASDYSAIVKDLEKCPFENAKKLAEQMEKLKKD